MPRVDNTNDQPTTILSCDDQMMLIYMVVVEVFIVVGCQKRFYQGIESIRVKDR